MIELIVSWVAGIVFATLFATFLELLLPSSSMQTFVRVIMGLLIMLAILNPVMGFFERALDSNEIAALAPRVSSAPAVEQGALAAARSRDKIVKDVYRRDLAKQMQPLVLGIEGVARAGVEVECNEAPDGPMTIKRVIVTVQPGEVKNQVDKVIIGKPAETPKLKPGTAARIQKRLGEIYQLQPGQIIVRPMKYE